MNTHVTNNIAFLFREFINKIGYITDILMIQKLPGSRFIATFKQVIKMLVDISALVICHKNPGGKIKL